MNCRLMRWKRPAHRLNVDVPGRKWQQIEAFASRLAFADSRRRIGWIGVRAKDTWADACCKPGSN